MNIKSQRMLLTLILVVYAIIMIIGATIPSPQDVPVFSGNTKYFHFVGFIILALLTLKTFEVYKFKHMYILSSITLLFFIFLTEFLQLFVSTRHYAYTDMLIDVGGCIIGAGLYLWTYFRR
jgi:VanZ family protein